MTLPRRLIPVVVGLLLAAFIVHDVRAQAIPREDPREEARRATERAPEEAAEAIRRASPLVVQAGSVDPKIYVLGPGDVLELDVWGRVSRTLLAPVSPEGTVFIPGTPPVRVAGQTLAWARERILRLVGESFRGVQAEVRLIQLRTFKVYVTGAVTAPGAFPVTSVTRASEVLDGAVLDRGASRRNIELRRLDGTRLRVDLELFQVAGLDHANPLLVDGDVISVPYAQRWVGVWGGVTRPRRVELAPGDSLANMILMTGGLVPAAVVDRALLMRFNTPETRESLWVALDAGAANVRVQDGDHLFVGLRSAFHQLHTVEIHGEVSRPGTYPLVLGRDRFSDLIRWAGGFTALANRTSIYLLRETGTAEADPEFERLVRLARAEMTESEYTKFQTRLAERKNSFRIDWTRVQEGARDIDPLLQPGDVVRVEQLVSTVRVEGQVRRPGFIDFVPGRTLRDYVDMAGGFTTRANPHRVSVSRAVTGQVIPARSLQTVLPGDFVWVPERRDVDAWGVFRDVVTVAGQVALLIFTLSR